MDDTVRQPIGSITLELNGNKIEISGPIDWVRNQCDDFIGKIFTEKKGKK